VSEELGVRYVLEGSVQRSDDRVRITAQLVDALTGNQILSERFDGETTDLFGLQDDITIKVLRAIHVQFTGAAPASKYYKGTHGLDCFLKFLEALGTLQRNTLADTHKAQQIAEEGLTMCPEIPNFYRLMALVNINYYFFDLSKSPQGYIEKAAEFLQKTLAMDANNADAYGNLSMVYIQKREYDKALAEAERSLTLDPGSAWALWRYARVLTFSGRPEEAIPLQEKAIRLNPLGPAPFYGDLGFALRLTGRLEEAVGFYKKALERAPNDFWFHAHIAALYIMMGRDEEARAAAAEVLRINPKFSVEWFAKTSLLKDRSVLDKYSDALRKAGLPDKPPPQP
jgi:adenylate cyclase